MANKVSLVPLNSNMGMYTAKNFVPRDCHNKYEYVIGTAHWACCLIQMFERISLLVPSTMATAVSSAEDSVQNEATLVEA
jgi:hypothetical protein